MPRVNGFIFLHLALLFFLFPLSPAVAERRPDPRQQVPHISAQKALQYFRTGRMMLLDVHFGKKKTRSDIIGAMYVPSNKLDAFNLRMPAEVFLGVFCK